MVKTVVLNCDKLCQREQAHVYLAQMLEFPAYYGRNLDALYDCLTGQGECAIVLCGADELRRSGGYGVSVLAVLEDAAQTNPNLRLVFEENI